MRYKTSDRPLSLKRSSLEPKIQKLVYGLSIGHKSEDQNREVYLVTPLAFNPLTGVGVVFPWVDLRKIFSGCHWMAKVPNGVETLPKISTD